MGADDCEKVIFLLYYMRKKTERGMAMASGKTVRIKLQRGDAPGGAVRQMEYGPDTTGCPAVEQAIENLYSGQDEESFWRLMSALNYALQMETEVLLPLENAPGIHKGPTPWAEHPIPADRAADLRSWKLHAENGKKYQAVFTNSAAASRDSSTSDRAFARRALRDVMETVLAADSVDGLVLNPWGRSATLEKALLKSLLMAAPGEKEQGEEEYEQGNEAWHRGDAAAAYESYHLSALLGCAAGMRMLGECYRQGKGVRADRSRAERCFEQAADGGDILAQIALGDLYAAGSAVYAPDRGRALLAYRQAWCDAQREPDIEYWPELCLRLAQHEVRYTSARDAQRMVAEARRGLILRRDEGDDIAPPLLAEAEKLGRELAGGGQTLAAYAIKFLQND